MTDSLNLSVDAQTFGAAMGHAVWLMTMGKAYLSRPIDGHRSNSFNSKFS